jgi:hypothetical protein
VSEWLESLRAAHVEMVWVLRAGYFCGFGSELPAASRCCDFFLRISAVLLTFSDEPGLVVLGAPSAVFELLVLVLGSSLMAARFVKEYLRSVCELVRAFFLRSPPWLYLRCFEGP